MKRREFIRILDGRRTEPIVCPFSLAAPPQSARLSASTRRFLRGAQ